MQNQLSNQIGNQISGSLNGIQTTMPQQMNQITPGQIGPGQMQQQLSHMQRKVRKQWNNMSHYFKIFMNAVVLSKEKW